MNVKFHSVSLNDPQTAAVPAVPSAVFPDRPVLQDQPVRPAPPDPPGLQDPLVRPASRVQLVPQAPLDPPASQVQPVPDVYKRQALESAYGADMWKQIKEAFEKENEGVTIELTIDKNLEDVISPSMKSGDYPDVVHLATGRPAALTETMTKDNALRDLSAILDMTVPGENVKVKDKILPGFLDTSLTNPCLLYTSRCV